MLHRSGPVLLVWNEGACIIRDTLYLRNDLLRILFLLQDKEPKGIIPLENISIREVPVDKSNKPFSFELFATGQDIIKACKVDKEGKVVEGKENSHDEKFHYAKKIIGKCVFFFASCAWVKFCSVSIWLHSPSFKIMLIKILLLEIECDFIFQANTMFIECPHPLQKKRKNG